MNIDISPIQTKLQIIEQIVGRQEYSGFGWIQKVDKSLMIYDFELLHVGSSSFTDIQPAKIMPLIDRSDNQNMRLWVHKHPMGMGIPGPSNWSYTDHTTCTETPMGGIPEMMKWSAAIVHTPRGWVGRIDDHIKGKTHHVPVIGIDKDGLNAQANELLNAYFGEYEYAEELIAEDTNYIQSVFDWIRSRK